MKTFLSSFELKNILLFTVLDSVFLALLYFAATGFNSFLNNKAQLLLGVSSAEQFQNQIITNPSIALTSLSSIKSVLFTAIGGAIFLTIALLLLFSLTQALIWNKLVKKTFSIKHYWKWNLLHLSLMIFIAFYLIIVLILTFLQKIILGSIENLSVVGFIGDFLNMILILIFLFFMFTVYFNFTKKYQVWESIGQSFHLLNSKMKQLWKPFLFIMGVVLLLSIINFFLQKMFPYQYNVMIVLSIILFLIFISWLRIYWVEVLSTDSNTF